MNRTSKRTGFTLVEILIVVGIIVLVAAIFVPVILNLTDRNQVPKGTSLLENALSLAKSRAVAEKRPNGIRLISAPLGLRSTASSVAFAWFDEIQYIEDPGDYVHGWVWGFAEPGSQTVTQPFWSRGTPLPNELPAGFDNVTVPDPIPNFSAQTSTGTALVDMSVMPRSRLLFGLITPNIAAPESNRWLGNLGIPRFPHRMAYSWYEGIPVPVQPGDVIELTGVGELYQIVAVSNDQAAGPAINNPNIAGNGVRAPILVLDRPLTRNISPSLTGAPNFRIIRQPRVVSSMPPFKLPQDVIIDITPSRVPFFIASPPTNPGPLSGQYPNADIDQSANIFMSGVSTGIGISNISGLTIPAGAPQQVAPLYVDIMFSPSGEVIPTSQTFGNSLSGPFGQFSVGASGLIALWVHQRGDPNLWAARQITAAQGNADNQALVAINTRTGFIGSYSINLKPGPSGVDPLYNARAGKERISADTGP